MIPTTSDYANPYYADDGYVGKGGISAMISAQHPTISTVIPARNEASNLQYVLPHIPSIVSEIILVDGHSTDGTAAVAQQLLPTIRIVKQKGEGRGDSLRSTEEFPSSFSVNPIQLT